MSWAASVNVSVVSEWSMNESYRNCCRCLHYRNWNDYERNFDVFSRQPNGDLSIEERRLLYLKTDKKIFDDCRFALNDFTILKRDTSSMITIHAFLDGAYFNSYWADGLIVATATGSTGYSLSCGGPIVFPDSHNFVITAVAPHNLNVRPIVVSDDSILSFEVEGRADNFLCTLDSRFESITADYQLAIRRCDFTLKVVQLHGDTYLKTLREKLSWGLDGRNRR